MKRVVLCLLAGIGLVLAALALTARPAVDEGIAFPATTPTAVSLALPSQIFTSPTTTAGATASPISTLDSPYSYWISPQVEGILGVGIPLLQGWQPASSAQLADLVFSVNTGLPVMEQVYVLAARFATMDDGVPLMEIKRMWAGDPDRPKPNRKLMMTVETRDAIALSWGEPGGDALMILPADKLLETAWAWRFNWAILPFDQLEPRWKVLQVDGISPLDWNFEAEAYPLTLRIGVQGEAAAVESYVQWLERLKKPLPLTNRDSGRMTVLIMTGVTALTRETAVRMERHGVEYPAQDIREWLLAADFTHISNEVAFSPDCPEPVEGKKTYQFCSQPEYFNLLTHMDADIIELTGNHLLDWGPQPFLATLNLYRQAGMAYFGGGSNLADARSVHKVEHHGNKLAFLGCNAVGPGSVWAIDDQPGANPCEREWMETAIRQLVSEGYLPIVTYQHIEQCTVLPHSYQRAEFRAAADAGAIIVSGSQAHCPQSMEFRGNAFIHYGLGNLFFDQMDDVTRRNFIDRYTFYDGRLISVELMTTYLEDYSRPRPMTSAERKYFLFEMFSASGWE